MKMKLKKRPKKNKKKRRKLIPVSHYNFELHFVLKYYEDLLLLDYEDEIEEETQEKQKEEKKINTSKSFKSDDCVICMDTPPNVLCNCGHICICENVSK